MRQRRETQHLYPVCPGLRHMHSLCMPSIHIAYPCLSGIHPSNVLHPHKKKDTLSCNYMGTQLDIASSLKAKKSKPYIQGWCNEGATLHPCRTIPIAIARQPCSPMVLLSYAMLAILLPECSSCTEDARFRYINQITLTCLISFVIYYLVGAFDDCLYFYDFTITGVRA